MVIVVATDEEYKSIRALFPKKQIIKTGVGYANVFKSLQSVDRNTRIYNIGFAGSNVIPKGTICIVKECKSYHPNVQFDEESYNISKHGYTCYTSNDFVLSTLITEPVLFDMELYAILSMGFTNIVGIKVVSDNLNQAEYDATSQMTFKQD